MAQYTLNFGGGRVCVAPYSLPRRRASPKCNNMYLLCRWPQGVEDNHPSLSGLDRFVLLKAH